MADEIDRGNPRPNLPSPDPSVLTTQALHEAMAGLREVFDAKLLVFEARLTAIDKATELFSENLTRVPTDTDKQIAHLKELHDEKFEGIDKQFAERDVRTEQAAIATKIAVDAALQAQKEAAGAQNESNTAAITKSEGATAKQIDALMALRQSDVKATDEKIADLKGRLDRGEGSYAGRTETRTETRLDIGSLVGVAGFILALVVGAAALFHTNQPLQIPVVPIPAR